MKKQLTTEIPSIETKYISRKSPRAKFNDYNGGLYFVTICTHNRQYYFGKIINAKMNFSQIGNYANDELNHISKHYPYADIQTYVIMPNHIHAIIYIRNSNDPHTNNADIPEIRSALSVVIGGFKRAITLYAKQNNIHFQWQSRFHDHIIRSNKDGNLISNYILNNVAKWDFDCFNNHE